MSISCFRVLVIWTRCNANKNAKRSSIPCVGDVGELISGVSAHASCGGVGDQLQIFCLPFSYKRDAAEMFTQHWNYVWFRQESIASIINSRFQTWMLRITDGGIQMCIAKPQRWKRPKVRSSESSTRASTEDPLALNENEGISCWRICRAPKHCLRLNDVDDVYQSWLRLLVANPLHRRRLQKTNSCECVSDFREMFLF